MNWDFIDLKQETINCKGVNLENLFFLSDGLPGYLLFPIVLSGLPIVGSPLEASDKSCLKNNPKCV